MPFNDGDDGVPECDHQHFRRGIDIVVFDKNSRRYRKVRAASCKGDSSSFVESSQLHSVGESVGEYVDCGSPRQFTHEDESLEYVIGSEMTNERIFKRPGKISLGFAAVVKFNTC